MSTFTPIPITSIFTRGQRAMLEARFVHADVATLDHDIMARLDKTEQEPAPPQMAILQKLAKPPPTLTPLPDFNHNEVMIKLCLAFRISKTAFLESKDGAKARAAYFHICNRFGYFDRLIDISRTQWPGADHRKASHGLESARQYLRKCPSLEPPKSSQAEHHAWHFTRSYERAVAALGFDEKEAHND